MEWKVQFRLLYVIRRELIIFVSLVFMSYNYTQTTLDLGFTVYTSCPLKCCIYTPYSSHNAMSLLTNQFTFWDEERRLVQLLCHSDLKLIVRNLDEAKYYLLDVGVALLTLKI